MGSKRRCICMECGTQFERYASAIKQDSATFCSRSCATRYRNLRNNPAKNEAVRAKISKNHADVSGKNNPMYGKKGAQCPSYIDGRTHFKGDRYRQKLLANTKKEDLKCALCESTENLQVHHKDGNHNNNAFSNLVWLCKSCHRNIAHEYIRDEKGRFKKIKTYNFFRG